MGQILHGSATTTEAVRRTIKHSQESLRTLSRRYGINQKTVAKWKKRSFVADLQTGPKQPKSTVLSIEDEAIVVAFRRHTLLPLDDCRSAGRGWQAVRSWNSYLRGLVCGLMTVAGGIDHTLPYLIPNCYTATVISAVVVVLKLLAIAFIQWHYMDYATPVSGCQGNAGRRAGSRNGCSHWKQLIAPFLAVASTIRDLR